MKGLRSIGGHMTSSNAAAQRFSMIRWHWLLGAGALLLVAPSCQRDKQGDPGELTIDRFLNGYGSIFCSRLVNCKMAEESFMEPCVSYLTRSAHLSRMKAAIADGIMSYDPAIAEECLAALRAANEVPAACIKESDSSPVACTRLLTPNPMDTGAPCFTYSQACKNPDDACAGPRCNQTCQPSGGLGQPCGAHGCDAGLYCDWRTEICAAQVPDGAPCTDFGSCGSSSYCEPFAHVCVPRAAVGEACASKACVPTAYCDASNTCVDRKASGDRCSMVLQCQEGLSCIAERCAVPVGEGEACAISTDCERPFGCDAVLRTCQAHRAVTQEGEACTGSVLSCQWDRDSEPEFRCDGAAPNPDGGVGTMGVCRWPHLGDACASPRNCPLGSYCDQPDGGGGGVCRSTALGTPCGLMGECPLEMYCSSSGCQTRIAQGTICTDASECAAMLTCRLNPIDNTAVCEEAGNAGSRCGDRPGLWTQCKLPNTCLSGVCTPTAILGAPCSSYDWCFTGVCQGSNHDAGILGTCGPYWTDGTPCLSDQQCASEACVEGVCVAACG